MLGPKSFWLESKALVLREKARKSDIDSESKAQEVRAAKEAQAKQLLAKVKPVLTEDGEVLPREREKWELEPISQVPLAERKDAFLDLLQKKAEHAKAMAAKRRQRDPYDF